MDAIVRALVTGHEHLALFGKPVSAADVRTLPDPCTVLMRQGFANDISFVVEKMRSILTRFGIVTDDLKAADIKQSDAAIRGMHQETASGNPCVDIACDNLRSGSIRARRCASFGNPSTDKDPESIERNR